MISCIGLVLAMQQSTRLAAAYGVAVTGTMAITSLVFYVVTTKNWHWPKRRALPLLILFLSFDLPYLASNLIKLEEGGWFPLAVGAGVFALMTTWYTGRRQLAAQFASRTLPLETLLLDITASPPLRVPGTAVFLTASSSGTPPVLLHHLKHNKVLHERVVLLSVVSADVPLVAARDRVQLEPLTAGFCRVVARYGFMQSPSVPEIMAAARKAGLKADTMTTTFYLGRETLLPSPRRGGMAHWRKSLFFFMARNSRAPTDYFGIPPGNVIELGMQVEL
jgi:KUP system potassium uptake protein